MGLSLRQIKKGMNITLASSLFFLASCAYNAELAYNKTYLDKNYNGLKAGIEEAKENTIPEEQMYNEIKDAKIIILADFHAGREHHKKMIDVLSHIKGDDMVFGMELFEEKQQKYIDDYLSQNIEKGKEEEALKDFFGRIGFGYMHDFRSRFGFHEIINHCRENRIKIVGVNNLADRKILDFLADSYKNGKDLLLALKENQEISKMIDDYADVSRVSWMSIDKNVVDVIGKNLREGKRFVLMMGYLHAEEGHMPKMIYERLKIDPVVIYQNCDEQIKRFTEKTKNINTIFSDDSTPQTIDDFSEYIKKRMLEKTKKIRELESLEFRCYETEKGKVVKIGNDYHIDTPWRVKDIFDYIGME